jgi:hypothetical protein
MKITGITKQEKASRRRFQQHWSTRQGSLTEQEKGTEAVAEFFNGSHQPTKGSKTKECLPVVWIMVLMMFLLHHHHHHLQV